VGLVALASAMESPLFPDADHALMQHDVGLTLAQGGWLATATI